MYVDGVLTKLYRYRSVWGGSVGNVGGPLGVVEGNPCLF